MMTGHEIAFRRSDAIILLITLALLISAPAYPQGKTPRRISDELPSHGGWVEIKGLPDTIQLETERQLDVWVTVATASGDVRNLVVDLRADTDALIVKRQAQHTVGIPTVFARIQANWILRGVRPGVTQLIVDVSGDFGKYERRIPIDIRGDSMALARYYLHESIPALTLFAIVAPFIGPLLSRKSRPERHATFAITSMLVAVAPLVVAFAVGVTLPSYSLTVIALIIAAGVFLWMSRLLDTGKGATTAITSSAEEIGVHEQPALFMTNLISRSAFVASNALRRANIHMATGITSGVMGLAFFFFSTTQLAPARTADSSPQLWSYLVSTLPRVTVLVFVELMAGFFLKQYAAGLEEFRYFERIQRRREAEFLVLAILREHPDSDRVSFVAEAVLDGADVGFRKGEESIVASAQDRIKNEYFEIIAKAIESIGKLAGSAKG